MADGDLLYLPTSPEVPHPLGRSVVWHDPRNRQYRALDIVSSLPPVRIRSWSRATPAFDQVDANCTAEAAVGLLRTQPHTRRFGYYHWDAYDEESERVALYKISQRYDPWQGEAYDGTSTDAPFKVLRERDVIAGWGWLFGVDELKEHVQRYGAAVVGTNWYWSMFDVVGGRITIDPGRGIAGGHAYEVSYYSSYYHEFEIINSWGPWGRKGRARIAHDDMDRLLKEQGEACTVLPEMVTKAA